MHDTAGMLIELGLLVLGLGIIGRLAERLGLSPIPLYLLGGLAFGEGGLVPLGSVSEFIEVGAEIGVVLLLLMLGLEYTASELVESLRTQYPAGLVDLLLNAVPGAVAGLVLGWGVEGAVALAGVTYISSSGVVAKILTELDRLGNRETPVVLGLLVIEDLTMAVYLPVLSTVVAGVGLASGSLTLALALATAGAALYVALRHGRLVSKAVSSDNPEMLLLVVLGLSLLVAGVAQELQVSAAVGAFLVGIALSGEVATTTRRLITPLRDLFAAVFFVFFGLSTNPSDIPPVLVPALLLALATAATKIATGWYAARRAGIGSRGRLRAGGVLVARGEFSIVIAGLAASAQPDIAALATAYVLILVVLGPFTARWTEPAVRGARGMLRARRGASADEAPASPGASGRHGPAQPVTVPPEVGHEDDHTVR